MKKITFYVLGLLLFGFSSNNFAQTLNQNAGWPNANWTVTGTFNMDPTAFEADPTASANFAFDDDDAGNPSDDDIAAESPVIDLTAAYVAGETWLTVTADYTYNDLDDTLTLEYWDADGAAWVTWEQFVATADEPQDNFCAGARDAYVSAVLNIAAFTGTQQSGFRYRISFLDDGGAGGGAWEWGFCFDAPTITSATPPSCPDPNTLAVGSILDTSAEFSWIESGSAASWDIELVDITAAGTPTGTPTNAGVTNPYTQMGLVELNDYEYYVRSDCGGNGVSNWVGPMAFTTTATCPDPSGLNVTNTTINSADLGWTQTGPVASWDIELVDITAAGTATGVATDTGVSNPFAATGLTDNNDYEFYVQADCSATWIGPFAFTTAAVPPVNDDCINAIVLTPGVDYLTNPVDGSFLGATDSGFTNSCGGTAINDVWYSVLVPGDGNITLETGADIATATPGNDTAFEVYTGDCGTLVSLDCDDDGAATGAYSFLDLTGLTPGSTLYIRLWGYGDDEFEPYSISAYNTSLSIGDFESLGFEYFPNPVKHTLSLNAQSTIQNVSVYNMLGQEVIRIAPNTIESEINMAALQSGAYFVKVTINDVTETIKIIKN